MNRNQDIWEKAARYFAGSSTRQEQKELEEWSGKASENDRQQFETAKQLWEKTYLQEDNYDPDTARGWQSLQLKISMREQNKRTFPYMKVAAAVLLLLCAALVFFINDQPGTIETTAHEEVKLILLPDGSQVWLNQQATLSYSETYNVDDRTVFLKGEAFFEVEKADGRRFTVLTETSKTEVLGTSFNVLALPNEPVKVQVATGKVAFASLNSDQPVLLKPGEEAVLAENNEDITTKPIEDINFRAWQSKQLTFQNTSLKALAHALEEYFHVKVDVRESLEQCRFTGTFKDPGIDQVLDVVALTGNLKITKNTDGYELTGQGCTNK